MPRPPKVDPISNAEKEEAVAELRELTGFAIDNTERQLFLKCAFRTGDISTVWLDPVLVCDLFWHLGRLLQDRPRTAGSAVKLATGVEAASYGYAASADD